MNRPLVKPLTPRALALREAEGLVCGARDEDYGTPRDNFTGIAKVWTVQLGPKLKEKLTAGDVAALMVGLKLCRVVTSPTKRDHWVDIAGYGAIGAEVTQPEIIP